MFNEADKLFRINVVEMFNEAGKSFGFIAPVQTMFMSVYEPEGSTGGIHGELRIPIYRCAWASILTLRANGGLKQQVRLVGFGGGDGNRCWRGGAGDRGE